MFEKNYCQHFSKFRIWSGAKVFESCRSRKMLSNEYLVAKIGADTADEELFKASAARRHRRRRTLLAGRLGAKSSQNFKFAKFRIWSGAKVFQSCRSRKEKKEKGFPMSIRL